MPVVLRERERERNKPGIAEALPCSHSVFEQNSFGPIPDQTSGLQIRPGAGHHCDPPSPPQFHQTLTQIMNYFTSNFLFNVD
jgi:hypothetical protein